MESLSDTDWDVVISGTGLQHSLLALALSRSAKSILHVDASDYYGGAEAALTLPELDLWAAKHQGGDDDVEKGDDDDDGATRKRHDDDVRVFTNARVSRPDAQSKEGPGARGYSIPLAPQLIHTRAALLSQLVSSKAFRQIEFLAVGSFFVYHSPSSDAGAKDHAQGDGDDGGAAEQDKACLRRIPSTREDVFSNAAIPIKAKRSLMKFLKFVLEHNSSDAQAAVWRPRAQEPLAAFLASEFNLDPELQAYIVSLTLSLDGRISVAQGLAAIHRHLSSMGVFGAGFAAVYPKWGGLAEIAQVGCRASAVGGAVYMLGVGIKDREPPSSPEHPRLGITLTNDVAVKTRRLVHTSPPARDAPRLTRLTAIIQSNLPSLFQTTVDGAPTPSVAVVAFPAGCSIQGTAATAPSPIYAMVHSSDTGECPAGQCVIYLSTLSAPTSHDILSKALSALLAALPGTQAQAQAEAQAEAATGETPRILYRLSYEQKGASASAAEATLSSGGTRASEEGVFAFDIMPLDLALDDAVLDTVRKAWDWITDEGSSDERGEYMNFKDREGVDDDDFAE